MRNRHGSKFSSSSDSDSSESLYSESTSSSGTRSRRYSVSSDSDSRTSSSSSSSDGSSSDDDRELWKYRKYSNRRLRHKRRHWHEPWTHHDSISWRGEDDSIAREAEEAHKTRNRLLLGAFAFVAMGVALWVAFLVPRGNGTSEVSQTGGSAQTSAGKPSPSSAAGSGTGADLAQNQGPLPSSAAASEIASSLGMLPAPFSALPMPSTVIQAGDGVGEYLQRSWGASSSKSGDHVDFTCDPFDGSDSVFRISYPKGSYSGNEGGASGVKLSIFGDTAARIVSSYQIAFGSQDGQSTFDFVLGGKLPGVFGGDTSSGCTGGKMSAACFSLRFMWRESGAGEVYSYMPQYDGFCNEKGDVKDSELVLCNAVYGQSLHRGSFTFKPGIWHTLTEVGILNSDPSPDETKANGVLAVYLDEQLAFQMDNVVFRTNESVFFSAFDISSFFGGSQREWASTGDAATYYKNLQFWVGSEPSSGEGEMVKPTDTEKEKR